MNTAFIGLDYIIDIMHPDGKIARSAAHAAQRDIIRKANRALAIAESNGWLKLLVKVGFAPNYLDQPKSSPMFGRAAQFGALKLGERGTDFHPELKVTADDLVIVKPRVSAFYATPLEAVLRANKIERLIVAGVSSSWAVQATVRDAHDRDYQVLIAEDACAAGDESEHQDSMKLMSAIARIITVDDMESL
ncbi:isochorismatase family cysteine hydrolase [Pseudomonas chlororaphis]|uniref:isochorismatase family cysteine hydrolase n=1 Tax=Pseudomonas chlororaphis TaxID=587753 RepID=UPI0015DF4081|nr:isochorismatase family cysteine hydrolase [Pseudomonas chlororaphis]QLL16101.1 cysteine hydrolase [Pseudomonas chlororaphis subsp. aurantiaca]